MAPKTRTSMTQRSQHFSALLSSAILEWVLMLLLLLEGLLSYLVTEFARLCKLHPPCPICTRLDHVFGETCPGYYRSLMCNSHKAEASSWAFCHIHQNLVDVNSMCEACLLSFATDNKSNLETYRSLAGKLGAGIGDTGCGHGFSLSSASEAKLMVQDALCSCCSRPFGVRRSYPFAVLQRKDSGIGVGVGETCRDVLGDRHTNDDEISHVMYSELKTSDSESEPRRIGGNSRCLMKEDPAVAADNLKENFTSSHAQTKIKDGNAEDEVARHSELTQVQNGVSDRKHSENSRELSSFKADIQSNDLPRKDGEQIEEPHTGDKPEDDVWHNALGSSEEFPGTDNDNSAETKAASVEPKPEFPDRTARQDSFRVHQQDLKLLLTQISTSSRAHYSSAAFADSPPTIPESQQEQEAILRNISRALSLERNYSGVSEDDDGVFFNGAAEADCGGGDVADRLKRRVELDRKSMALLWAELEEERGAAAVAASQAMAMITRLQEEKAAARTEAAQCRRAMEELSAYDGASAAVRGLEAEVERCWAMFRELAAADEIRDQMRLPRRRREGGRDPGGSGSAGDGFAVAGFGDEGACVSDQLRRLTGELVRLSNDSRFVGAPGFSAEEEDEEGDDGEEEEEEEAEIWAPGRRVRNGNSFTEWQRLQSTGTIGSTRVEVGMAELQDEIAELGGRLRALEADRISSFHTT